MNQLHKFTPSPIVIEPDCVLVTTAHGTYPVHRGWLDINAAIDRYERQVSRHTSNAWNRTWKSEAAA